MCTGQGTGTVGFLLLLETGIMMGREGRFWPGNTRARAADVFTRSERTHIRQQSEGDSRVRVSKGANEGWMLLCRRSCLGREKVLCCKTRQMRGPSWSCVTHHITFEGHLYSI